MQNTAPAGQADSEKQNRFVVHNEAEELITELARKLSV
jgi:hypothetical protein